jgi:hypothetical protein
VLTLTPAPRKGTHRRTVAGAVEDSGGFPVSKPHGSLERSDSIAIDVEGVARPLKGVAREAFRELVADRVVVVVGYSGWDYDLFPLLVHAGREWNTEVVWVLFDDASMNERVAKIQLALGEGCTVLNGRRRALLPLLAGGVEKPGDAVRRDHRAAFGRILAAAGDDALAEALVGLLTPSGVAESEGVVRRLCHELLRLAESNRIGGDDVLLRRLGVVVGWSESEPDIRRRAAELAVATTLRLQREPAVRSFRRLLAGDDDDASVEGELRRVERDLRDFPFAVDSDPNPTLARWSIMTDLRIRKADLLLHAGRRAEAEALAARILSDTRFPSSGVSEDAWIVTDGYAPWKLYAILAVAAAERGDDDTAEAHLCEALDLLWRELEFWDLDEALRWVAYASRRRGRECGAAALEFAVRVARFSREPYSELHALERKLDYGVGTVRRSRAGRGASSHRALRQRGRAAPSGGAAPAGPSHKVDPSSLGRGSVLCTATSGQTGVRLKGVAAGDHRAAHRETAGRFLRPTGHRQDVRGQAACRAPRRRRRRAAGAVPPLVLLRGLLRGVPAADLG